MKNKDVNLGIIWSLFFNNKAAANGSLGLLHLKHVNLPNKPLVLLPSSWTAPKALTKMLMLWERRWSSARDTESALKGFQPFGLHLLFVLWTNIVIVGEFESHWTPCDLLEIPKCYIKSIRTNYFQQFPMLWFALTDCSRHHRGISLHPQFRRLLQRLINQNVSLNIT